MTHLFLAFSRAVEFVSALRAALESDAIVLRGSGTASITALDVRGHGGGLKILTGEEIVFVVG